MCKLFTFLMSSYILLALFQSNLAGRCLYPRLFKIVHKKWPALLVAVERDTLLVKIARFKLLGKFHKWWSHVIWHELCIVCSCLVPPCRNTGKYFHYKAKYICSSESNNKSCGQRSRSRRSNECLIFLSFQTAFSFLLTLRKWTLNLSLWYRCLMYISFVTGMTSLVCYNCKYMYNILYLYRLFQVHLSEMCNI